MVEILFADLGHKDHVLFSVEPLQQGAFTVELVPKDNDNTAQADRLL